MYSKKHFPPLAGSAFLCLLFHDLRVQQVKDRLVGAPEVGLLAEKLGDARAVKVGAHRLGHAAAGNRLALTLERLTQLEHRLRTRNVHARHTAHGEQQRVAIARAIAAQPEIIYFDEPTSALDPISTGKIEDLIHELKKEYTIVIVTHNMQQAARISDRTAFFLLGELVECGPTSEIFSTPKDKRTEDYISGRFG